MMKVLLAHPGTQHAFTLAAQLSKRDLLYEFWTCFGISAGKFRRRSLAALPSLLYRKLENRIAADVTRQQLRTVSWLEFCALYKMSRGARMEEVMMERNEKFQNAVAADSISASDTVIGFDTSAWLLADRAHRSGKPLVLDQSHAHPLAGQDRARKVARDFPAWEQTFPAPLPALLAKQNIEYERADLIVTGSSFARDTLAANQVARGKIRINPYGVDLQLFRPRKEEAEARPLRFVFMGSISARKGIPLLLAAWQRLRLNDAELWLMGHLSPSIRKLIPELPNLRILGRPPRSKQVQLLRSCHVFVLPSYFEGFGLVLLEAMACGLPVVTTTATAGPDIVTQGEDGWIIEPGDIDALVEVMRLCFENRDRLSQMGTKARRTAERFTWDAYGDRWAKILRQLGGCS